jgi:hypothetical protein
VQTNGSSAVAVGPRSRVRHRRRVTTGSLVWPGLLRVLRHITRYKPTDLREFKISFSVRDLAPKGRAVKDQFDALVAAVQKAGSYPARDDAARAVHAVMDAFKDRVPPDVLTKLSESLNAKEAAGRLRRAAPGPEKAAGPANAADAAKAAKGGPGDTAPQA